MFEKEYQLTGKAGKDPVSKNIAISRVQACSLTVGDSVQRHNVDCAVPIKYLDVIALSRGRQPIQTARIDHNAEYSSSRYIQEESSLEGMWTRFKDFKM